MNPSKSTSGSSSTTLASSPLTTEQCRLVEKHYPLVRAVVGQMRHSLPVFADLDELHSVGLLGLIAAVRRFDAAQTKTFDAYAAMRIRGAILDELRRLDWMPRSARQRARQLRQTVSDLEQTLGRVPTEGETRDKLGLNQSAFDRLQQRVQTLRFIPLDQPVGRGTETGTSLHETIADEDAQPTYAAMEQDETLRALSRTMNLLPDRHRQVIMLYYFHQRRLAEIAEAFGVTEARICQIHGQALQLLRQRWVDRN